MECIVGTDDTRFASNKPHKFQRGFNSLRAAVTKKCFNKVARGYLGKEPGQFSLYRVQQQFAAHRHLLQRRRRRQVKSGTRERR